MFTSLRHAVLGAALLLAACASGPRPADAPAPGSADSIATLAGQADYRIGANDLIAVTVFQVEDLDREVRVNNAGQVSLPLIGAVQAAGRTVDELQADIAQAYRARYLQNPQVTVFVKEYANQRVTVGGAVKKPGIYPMTSRLTLLQALSLAEGATEIARLNNVLVFRKDAGERRYARFDVKAIAAGEQPDPELQAEDVVVVDTSGGKVALQNLIKLAPFVAVWRAYR